MSEHQQAQTSRLMSDIHTLKQQHHDAMQAMSMRHMQESGTAQQQIQEQTLAHVTLQAECDEMRVRYAQVEQQYGIVQQQNQTLMRDLAHAQQVRERWRCSCVLTYATTS